MQVELMNMCMIHDVSTNKIVVLDKVVKEGWEGLTFPGGHVESMESLTDSVIREVKEETGLTIKNPIFKGFIHWLNIVDNSKQIGILYYTKDFEGELVGSTDEGEVYWMDLDEFLNKDNKSMCMDDCMQLYLEDKFMEAITTWDGKELSPFKFY